MRAYLYLVTLLATASVARADVIEISEDGEARIMNLGPAQQGKFGQPRLDSDVGAAPGDLALDPYERAAQRNGIEVGLLKAVAWTESRGRSDAISRKGARGIMQLMPGTAAELGVDPSDPIANINGGAAYLARQIATFGSVPLALAAYNAGPGAVMRYRGIPPYAETRAYVTTIMGRWAGPAGIAKSKMPEINAAALSDSLPTMLIEVSAP